MAKKLKIFVLVFVVALSLGLLAACAHNEYTLKYAACEGGGVTGETEQVVKEGEDGSTVTAVADFGYKFVKWSDGVTTAERTDRHVDGNVTVTAEFEFDNMTVMNHLAEQVAEKMFDFTMAPQDMQEDVFIGGGDSVGGYDVLFWYLVDGWKAVSAENAVRLDTVYDYEYCYNETSLYHGRMLYRYLDDDKYRIYLTITLNNSGSSIYCVEFQCTDNFQIEYCDWCGWQQFSDLPFSSGLARFRFDNNYVLQGNAECSENEILDYIAKYTNDLALLFDETIKTTKGDVSFLDKMWQYDIRISAGYSIAIQLAGNSHIIDHDIIQYNILSGQAPTITCVPDEGYRFVMWSDGVTSPTRTDVKPTDGNMLALYAIVEKIN